MAPDNRKARQIMAEVGEGNLNAPHIPTVCKESGAIGEFVEQDVYRQDPFESLAIHLKKQTEMLS